VQCASHRTFPDGNFGPRLAQPRGMRAATPALNEYAQSRRESPPLAPKRTRLWAGSNFRFRGVFRTTILKRLLSSSETTRRGLQATACPRGLTQGKPPGWRPRRLERRHPEGPIYGNVVAVGLSGSQDVVGSGVGGSVGGFCSTPPVTTPEM
jgi:hypothetical protein